MSDKLNYEVESAKLAANYWNGLAIATMALGVLPFVLGTSSSLGGVTTSPDWVTLAQATAIFPAAGLSSIFRTLAKRAISKACEGY